MSPGARIAESYIVLNGWICEFMDGGCCHSPRAYAVPRLPISVLSFAIYSSYTTETAARVSSVGSSRRKATRTERGEVFTTHAIRHRWDDIDSYR